LLIYPICSCCFIGFNGFSTPILAISRSCLDFSFKSKLSSNFELICC
jgi:hypothetical protein